MGAFDPYSPEGAPMGLAIFHTAFNVINVAIMIGFVPLLVKLAIKSVKSKGGADEEYQLEYISTGILATPEMSVLEAQKEIARFGEITSRMNGFVKSLLTEQDNKKISKTLARIKKYEDITDRIEIDVADYLAKVSQDELSESSSLKVRGMLSIIGDLERIGDIYYQMSKAFERKFEKKIWFIPSQREALSDMFDMVDASLTNMCENLNTDSYSSVEITKANELEDALNIYRKKIRKEHLKNVEKGEYNFDNAAIYSDIFNSLEKVGDHTINVTEGIVGEV